MSIQRKRDERAKLVHDAREILDRAEKEKRALSEEEKANYDRAFEDIEAIGEDIKRIEELERVERELEKPVEKRANPATKKPDSEEVRKRERRAWQKYLQTGFKGLTPEETRALSKGTDSEGGHLSADEQFVADLIKEVDDRVDIRRLARRFTLDSSDQLTFPRRAARLGDPTWTTELLTGSDDSSLSYEQVTLAPNPVARRIKVSRTLLRRSAVNAEAEVMSEFAQEFAEVQENAYMTGSGSGEPEGIFTVGEISTGRDEATDNTTSAVTFDGLINAKYKLRPQYHGSAQWLFHRDAIKQISKLKDNDNQYLWEASRQAGQPDMLLGNPVIMNEFVPNTFTTGLYVGAIADFSKYYIVDVLDFQVERADELYLETNQVGFFGRYEGDGKAVLEEAFVRVTLA